MYNENIKELYISQNDNTLPSGYLEKTFNTTKDFEILLDKDLSQFTVREITDMYKFLDVKIIEVLLMANSQLGLYTNWYFENYDSIDYQNHYREFTIEMLNKCIDKSELSVLTRQDLLSRLSNLENPVDKFVVLALFEGIKGEQMSDLLDIKITDITDNEIKLKSGKVKQISDELVEFAKESAATMKYYKNDKVSLFRKDQPLLVIKELNNTKDCASQHRKSVRIQYKLSTLKDLLEIPKNMGANQIVNSGKVHFVKQECQKYNLTPQQFLDNKELCKRFYYQYDINRINKKAFLLKNEDYFKDENSAI